jgi:hypothetical protein
MMQLRNRDLLRNQDARQTGGLTPRRLIRNWSAEEVWKESPNIDLL